MPSSPPTSPPTAQLPTTAHPAVRSLRLDVVRGPDAGATLRSRGDRVVIGTHRTADLVLTDPTVSRFHCELVLDGDGALLRDLGSKNRTLLDTVEIDAARLRGPTIVTLGETELRVDLGADPVRLELAPGERFGRLVGASPAMRAAFARLERAAASPAHLWIEGETGTGKDAAATAVHEHGPRAAGPLDVVDCAGAGLEVEEQLFGKRDRAGALERCAGGTLVLDELDALGRTAQRALARAIESRSLRRIGRDDTVALDVRLIATTRRNLRVDVNADRFRADLFDLVAVLHVRLPPLRERPEDVPLLLASLIDELGGADRREAAQLLAPESIEQLRGAPWLGNVRELRAHVERALAAAVAAEDPPAPPLIDASVPLREARRRWIRYFERAYLTDLLARAGGNVSAAATRAGVDRVHLHRMITQCGLRRRE